MMKVHLKNESKPIVAHFNNIFFAGSETFIYQYISHLRVFKPICVAHNFANLDQFPFPSENMYSLSSKRYSCKWFYQKLNHRVLCNDPMLMKVLKKTGCSLIHAHFGPNGCLAVSSKVRLGLPLITTFYGYDLSKKDALNKYMKRYEILFEKGDLFLVEGPFMRGRLIELGCPPGKIQIQRIAIPVSDIPFVTRKPKASGEKVVLLFAGRFVEKKGITTLIKALARVNTEFKNYELRLIGSGPMEKDIRKLVKTLDLDRNVIFLGFLPYKEYLGELLRADIFVHPSVTASDGDSEGGAPTVILEAQASGLPIISTYHADIPNIVEPGRSALLSQEYDDEGLAENICTLLYDQEKWEQMGLSGRLFVERNHNIEIEVQSLEKRYLRLIG